MALATKNHITYLFIFFHRCLSLLECVLHRKGGVINSTGLRKTLGDPPTIDMGSRECKSSLGNNLCCDLMYQVVMKVD
jgi:hypothetical protein